MSAAAGNGCPHCQAPLFRKSEQGDKMKIGRTAVVLHKSGDIEVNCGRCKRAVIIGRLGSGAVLRKGVPRLRLGVRTDQT